MSQVHTLTPDAFVRFSFNKEGDFCRFFAAAEFLAGESKSPMIKFSTQNENLKRTK